MSYPCTNCVSDRTRVIDSRYSDLNDGVRRRRECDVCGSRFTTREVLIDELAKPDTIDLSALPERVREPVRELIEALSSDTLILRGYDEARRDMEEA